MLHREAVLSGITGRYVTPVAALVPSQQAHGLLGGQDLQGTGCGHYTAQGEEAHHGHTSTRTRDGAANATPTAIALTASPRGPRGCCVPPWTPCALPVPFGPPSVPWPG